MKTGNSKTINVLKNGEVIKTFNAPIYYADIDEDYVKGEVCFHFRKNRNYRLPEDLDFWDWDLFDEYNSSYEPKPEDYDYEDWKYGKERYEEMIKKLEDEYYWNWLDWYEHSAVAISIAGTGMQCRFDTSNKVGIVAIKKEYCMDEKDGQAILLSTTNEYSDWFNGWVYEFNITEDIEYTNGEYGSIYNEMPIEDTRSEIYFSSNDMDDEIKNIVEGILEDRKIEYDKIEING